MHDLSTQTLFSKYTLRGVPFDPVTGTMMALTAAGAGMSAAGTIMGGKASANAGQAANAAAMQAGDAAIAQGEAAQRAAEFRAKQEDQAAQESRAVAQRGALEKQREGRFALSSLQARAAAGGGGADDPTVLNLAGNIAQRSEFDALFDMYKGENRARGLEDEAMGTRMSGDAAYADAYARRTGDLLEGQARLEEGKAKQKASYMSAAGTIIGGAGSAFGQYNKIPSYRYG